MEKNKPELSIIIPIYGSEEFIRERYDLLTGIMRNVTDNYEILFCNDASPDNSLAVLKEIEKENDHLRVLNNPVNLGLCGSVRRMISESHADILAYTDVDLSFDPKRIGDFLKLMEDHDVVVASRYTGIASEIPIQRKIASRCYWLFCKIFFPIPIKDIGSGFFMFRKSCYERIKMVTNGFGIHIDFHAKMNRIGCRYAEVPVEYDHWAGPENTFNVLKYFWPTLRETVLVWLSLRSNPMK